LESLPYGEAKKMLHGAVYKFRCDPGATLHGSETIYCDGHSWNDTAPKCLSEYGFGY
jgi:hypothetical protein